VAKRFLFLEITNSEIINLITGVRAVATGRTSVGGVHVTIRGPYNREIPRKQIEQYDRQLKGHPLLLEGIGRFEVQGRHVVYMEVQHPGLRKIWWKPDFPVHEYGFNPHVTLYEGGNIDVADRLERFMKREGLKLLTWDFRVTAYVSDHRDFFKSPRDTAELFLELVNRGLVRADILARLNRALTVSTVPEEARRVV